MTPAHYPTDREVDLVLRGGSTIHVRPIRPDDESVLLDFLRSLSLESRMLRYFSAAIDIESAAHQQSHTDDLNDFGLVAMAGIRERIVGHAMYAALEPVETLMRS